MDVEADATMGMGTVTGLEGVVFDADEDACLDDVVTRVLLLLLLLLAVSVVCFILLPLEEDFWRSSPAIIDRLMMIGGGNDFVLAFVDLDLDDDDGLLFPFPLLLLLLLLFLFPDPLPFKVPLLVPPLSLLLFRREQAVSLAGVDFPVAAAADDDDERGLRVVVDEGDTDTDAVARLVADVFAATVDEGGVAESTVMIAGDGIGTVTMFAWLLPPLSRLRPCCAIPRVRLPGEYDVVVVVAER